jgi:glycosyltransferase involved in cell wall biosynthesis
MDLKTTRLVVVQLAMGAYRQGFLDKLLDTGCDVQFLVGDEHFLSNLITDVESPLVKSTGRNVFLFGRTFGFQRNVLRAGFKAPRLVLESNPRIITAWLLLIMRRLAGRPTYVWGHADSRSGAMSRSRFIRWPMQWLCTGFIAYTSTEQAKLKRRFEKKDALVAHNALYAQADMQCLPDRKAGTDLILIGRLVSDKKPGFAVDAFCRAARALPCGARLHVVGDGPLMSELEARVRQEVDAGRVIMHGKVNDIVVLRELCNAVARLWHPGDLSGRRTARTGDRGLQRGEQCAVPS